MSLDNRHLLLGVTGGIAAYKTPALVRACRQQGAQVRVVMSQGAKALVAPLALQALSGHPVIEDEFAPPCESGMSHIELARWADCVLIAPATAHCIAKLTHGLADDCLTTLCLATQAPLFIAPAMNQQMWLAKRTQANVVMLRQTGIHILGPVLGEQACGEVGPGRMLEPQAIVEELSAALMPKLLSGYHVLITAGPTREPIDPVRYLSNHSSGKMGFAVAQAARQMGAKVTLISGPVALPTPLGVTRIDVNTAQDMYDCVMRHAPQSDVFISAAAVADYRVATVASRKVKKSANTLNLVCRLNPDILASVAQSQSPPFTVGFAAETHNVVDNAAKKRKDKCIDMICANEVGGIEKGFYSDENALVVLSAHDTVHLKKASKIQLGQQLMALIARQLHAKDTTQDTRRSDWHTLPTAPL